MGLWVPATLFCVDGCIKKKKSRNFWATAPSPNQDSAVRRLRSDVQGSVSTVSQFVRCGHAVTLCHFTDDQESSVTSFKGLWNDHTAASAHCDLRQDRWLLSRAAQGRPQLCGTYTHTEPCWQAKHPRNKRAKMAAPSHFIIFPQCSSVP